MNPSNFDYSRLTNRRLAEMGDFVREHNIKYENGILINQDAYEEIREDLDAWRFRHIRPMDDIFDAINELKTKHPEFDYDVAERLKRLPSILGKLGIAGSDPLLQTVFIGVANLVFTVIALWLVDKFGRKTLLVCGCFGCTASLAYLTYAYSIAAPSSIGVLAAILAYIGFFALSLSPLMMCSETI